MGWRDADDERDDVDFSGTYGDSGVESLTVPCPYCFHTVYDDSDCCPGCGKNMHPRERITSPVPWWMACGIAICLIIILTWFVH